MKKLLLLIAVVGMLATVVSCGDDDEPIKRGDGIFTVNTPMINHMYNTVTGEVIGIGDTYNKLVIDTGRHTAQLVLAYNNGGDHTVTYNDLTAKNKRQGFYELRSPSDATFSGYVDFNEASMRYQYTTADGIRVISTIREVFFLKTQDTIAYLDTTETTLMENVMYQFNINPLTMTAIVKVMEITHAKDLRFFHNITGYSVPVKLTNTGYDLDGKNITTSAYYVAWVDSTGSQVKTTNAYPFKIFNASVDLVNDHMSARFMMGDSAIVTASGRTYPDYTPY